MINFGKLTDATVDLLETLPWHLESHIGDEHTVRVVYPSIGRASRWFSDSWEVVRESFIRPWCEWSESLAHRPSKPMIS